MTLISNRGHVVYKCTIWGCDMLTYNNQIIYKNVTYSIDKLVIDFEFKFVDGISKCQLFLNSLSSMIDLSFTNWTNTKFANYKHQFIFNCNDDNNNTFWLGVGFNGSNKYEEYRARIEFNPNKVFNSYVFKVIYNLLVLYSSSIFIKRFDVAFDYPVLRENTYLLKDNRKYREERLSYNDRTQYLGKHNNHGFVKLYNKKIESSLSFPLTRLEITLDYDKSAYNEFLAVLPTVKYLDDMQFAFDGYSLNDTDRYILITIYDNLDNLKMLGRRKQKKIECILSEYTRNLEVDFDTYSKLLKDLDIYKKKLEVNSSCNPFTLQNEIVSNLM